MTPEPQSRRDALADAETLRLVFAESIFGRVLDLRPMIELLPDIWERQPLGYAEYCGRRACYATDYEPDSAGWWAFHAAGAAFRAVPGLRGE